jgi:integrase
MATKRLFTDRTLKSLKPAPAGRYEIFDVREPRLGVRVGDGEDRTRGGRASDVVFILYTRIPKDGNPTRRRIGKYPQTTLEAARKTAGEWLQLIDAGKDPAEVAAARHAEAKRQAALEVERSFATVFLAFKAKKLSKERQGHQVAADMEREFLPHWAAKPIDAITQNDVLGILRAKCEQPAQGRNLLTHARRFFNWSIDQLIYDITSSPCDRIKPEALFGKKLPRQNILNNDEVFALWRAAGRLSYPLGQFYRLLLLTGLRLNELADARWDEIHDGVLTIPASRMKGEDGEAKPHAVPLPRAALDILEQLPRGRGPYVFSTTGGATPVWISTGAKKRVDKQMLRTLRALARRRGEDHRAVKLEWVNHDLRRVVRSGLSALRIDQEVKERVLGHVPAGLVATYDTHQYIDEKREALELWARHLRSIVEPRTGNVIELARA